VGVSDFGVWFTGWIMKLHITRCQFHQSSTHSFYARSSPKRNNSVKSSVSFYAFVIYARKSCTRTLVKLCLCVNFINVLCTAFALLDTESAKNTVKSSVSFYAFGIYELKSCTRTLMKLSPGFKFSVTL